MKFILPIALTGSLTREIHSVIYKLADLVQWILEKEIKTSSIESAKNNAFEVVCLIKKYFPSSMLPIQVHLLVHVVEEVEIAGIVHCRWMFFLERFMKMLKGFV